MQFVLSHAADFSNSRETRRVDGHSIRRLNARLPVEGVIMNDRVFLIQPVNRPIPAHGDLALSIAAIEDILIAWPGPRDAWRGPNTVRPTLHQPGRTSAQT
jgi:hypothetical protein